MSARTVCLDFDGVLHSYDSGWNGHAPTDLPTPGAQQFVRDLLLQGFEVVVQSTRATDHLGLQGIEMWMAEHEFPAVPVVAEKPKAVLYVDDRGLRFEGDFREVLRWIDEHPDLEPWNRRT